MSFGRKPQTVADLTEMMGQRADKPDFPLGAFKPVTHRGAVNGLPGKLNQWFYGFKSFPDNGI